MVKTLLLKMPYVCSQDMENKVGTNRQCLSCWLDFTVPEGVLEVAGGTGLGGVVLNILWICEHRSTMKSSVA